MSCCKLIPDMEAISKGDDPNFALQFARIENHYFVNGAFMEDDG